MVLKGNLQNFSVTQLLNIVNLAQKTGTLRIYGEESQHVPAFVGSVHAYDEEHHGQQAEVYFRAGQVLAVSLNTLSDELVMMLNRTGKLSDQQIQSLRPGYENITQKAIALHLTGVGLASREDIVNAVRTHTLDAIHEIINWEKKHFEFTSSLPDFSERVLAPIEISKVIKDATRYSHESRKLTSELSNLDCTLRFAETSPENLDDITLTVEESLVIGYINSTNSIQEIARICGITHTAIRRIVLHLEAMGIIQVVEPDGSIKPMSKFGTELFGNQKQDEPEPEPEPPPVRSTQSMKPVTSGENGTLERASSLRRP